jgi:hypothetical protein
VEAIPLEERESFEEKHCLLRFFISRVHASVKNHFPKTISLHPHVPCRQSFPPLAEPHTLAPAAAGQFPGKTGLHIRTRRREARDSKRGPIRAPSRPQGRFVLVAVANASKRVVSE